MTQETKTCPTHHLELRFMPEGISRKGTRYNAFWACPNRDCKHTENIEEKQGHFLSMQAEFRRAKEISYFNSVNGAIEITNAYMEGAANDFGSYEERKNTIKKSRDWLFQEWSEFYKKEIMEVEE